MEIVVLQGSPHKNGSSNLLATQFIKGAQEQGHEVTALDIAHMEIHPCIGCGHCGMDGDCVQKDDIVKIKEALLQSDMAVFVTPIYYFGISAQLKMVIDRFYSYTMKLSEKKLKTAFISAAWNEDDETSAYAKAHYQKICNYMNFQDQGMVIGKGCGSVSMTEGSVYMEQAYKLGKSI